VATVRELITKIGFKVDESELKRANRALQGVKDGLGKNLASIRRATFAMTAGFAGAGASLGFFLKNAGDMEQVTIAFETMLNSGEKASKLLQEITEFASKTPFQLTEIIQSSKQLLSFKVAAEEIIPTMTTLGNISAGVGKDKLPTLVRVFGRIQAKGKASMEEINMLMEAGVPILDSLARHFNIAQKEVFDYMRQGKVTAKDFKAAMKSMAGEGGLFNNLMIKQSKSMLGLFSNVIDVFEILSIQIGEKLLPAAKKMAVQVLDWVGANREMLKQEVGEFMLGLADAFKMLFKFAKVVIASIVILSKMFGGLRNVIKLVTTALIAFTSYKIIASVMLLAGAIKHLRTAFLGLSVVQFVTTNMMLMQARGATFGAMLMMLTKQAWAATVAFAATLVPILLWVAGISALVLLFQDLYAGLRGYDSLGRRIADWMEKSNFLGFKTLSDYLADVIDSFRRLGVLSGIKRIFKPIGEAFSPESLSKQQMAVANMIGNPINIPTTAVVPNAARGESNVSQMNTNNFTINGATDPKATADAVAAKMREVNDQDRRSAQRGLKTRVVE
jgi:tape measure domain-containing protein